MGNQQGWAALEFTVRLVQVSNGRGEHMGLAFANRRVLLKTEFSSRSLTVLSGRVTEWSDRKIGYFILKASTSRVHSNWAASAVQLDPTTWILEYESSLTLDNSMLFSAVAGSSNTECHEL
ncbi:SIGMA 1-TYPE OPIOID RECEPTOR-RELATED [Salix purpurea]|uniref:SIGMA 1-TYPE OPIOID RECEPTOR-RELATED n=1 Tax=Salix purpurea TaxID=77065 RepID=A0A9Q0U9L6_SALPP|nr:SIGMA 1-TYPE OPIOID RECEPTOR-RELATED [Salix purpurea]